MVHRWPESCQSQELRVHIIIFPEFLFLSGLGSAGHSTSMELHSMWSPCLLSFLSIISIHVAARGSVSLFFWLNDVPPHPGPPATCPGLLRWGPLFALGSSSAMNVHVHLSVSLSSSLLGVYLGKDLLYHVATLHLTFGERPGFPKKLPHFTILPAKQESASFSTSSFDQ